jgi:hypothetical protein
LREWLVRFILVLVQDGLQFRVWVGALILILIRGSGASLLCRERRFFRRAALAG